MRNVQNTAVSILALLILVFATAPALAVETDKEALKVCADPYMLPFSNQEKQGYENEIARLFGEKLGLEVEYEFFPQRIGFIRNTLRAEVGSSGEYKCDLVITVPENFELAATTDPYYSTPYVLVYVKGRGLDEVTDPEMLVKVAEKKDIKIGLTDKGPAQMWVFGQGLMGHMVPYQGMPGDPKVNPGQKLLEELVAGNIDATIIWGPTAGYFVKKYREEGIELAMLPLKDDPQNPNLRFTYSMSMAVRYGEKEWKETINRLIAENREEIHQILRDYGIPLVEKNKQ